MNPNELSKSSQKEEQGHDWWANKHDEKTQGARSEFAQKKQNKQDTTFHGRKKFDYEESASNNRTYQEEFNVIKMRFLYLFFFFR